VTTCYVITDSYGQQSPSFAEVMATRLGWDLTVDAVGGSGRLNGSPTNNFRVRVPAALAAHPDIVMVAGSINDKWYSVEDVVAESRLLWASLASVPLIYDVLMCPSDAGGFGPTVMAPYAAALAAAAPANVHFISGVGWITDANAIAYEAADHVHPMDVGGAGAKYLGMRLAFAISPPATGLEY
jgi:hypothetical protein